MRSMRCLVCGVMALAIAASAAVPAGATTLIRAGLDELVAANGTILVGEVVDAESYWNADGTFILTDVRIAPLEVLKGRAGAEHLTVTLMGGTVGDLTTLIVAGAELVPGHAYLLFLDEQDLPGVRGVQTVRDHVQGVFDLVRDPAGGVRAVSQAVRHPLVPDLHGRSEPPGGTAGLALEEMVRSIDELTGRRSGARAEVK